MGAVEQNCRVAHEVPSKSMGIMLGLAIITRAFHRLMPWLKSQLAESLLKRSHTTKGNPRSDELALSDKV